ncbi:MAG TPA: DUF2782 domain-containing protein [Methylococcaceae bacterium]|nr:DUF2782 domain-containing protein [Methylococcaceae bacterium]
MRRTVPLSVLLLLASLARAEAPLAPPPPENDAIDEMEFSQEPAPAAESEAAPESAGGEPAAVPEPPDLPETVQSGENMEPDITIIKRGKETIQEYRINGRLYMVKITPSIGPPYYLVDNDGDGNMDARRSQLESGLKVPQWVLFSW